MPVISITCLVYLLQYLFSFGFLRCRIYQPQILHYPLHQGASLHFPIWVCQNYLPLNQVFYLFLLLQCIFWKRYSICWLQLIQYRSRVSWQFRNSILDLQIFFENQETSFEARASIFDFRGLRIAFWGLSFKGNRVFRTNVFSYHPFSYHLQSQTKVLGTPESDSMKMCWQAILQTICNDITGIATPLPPRQCWKRAMTNSSR